MENKMNFKKLEFKENSGDWFAETYHNVLMIFRRKIVIINEETLITSLKDSDVFVLSCFGSVYEFDTFEECEIKANEENQKHLQKNIDEITHHFQSEFTIIDVCKNCGKINITTCKHDSCYNHQCSCGYLTGFIGRNHAN